MRSDWKVSIRRACSTLRIDRALYVYKPKRGDQAALKGRIKDICEEKLEQPVYLVAGVPAELAYRPE